MTKAKDFVAALQNQRSAQPRSVEDYWKRQEALWLGDLEALRGSIRQWMGPVVEARAAAISDKSFSIMEPDLGRYDAPGLEISLLTEPPQVVLLRPRGLRVVGHVEIGGNSAVGAAGRVDLECGVRREILLRFHQNDRTTWYSFSAGKKRELDEEVFFDLLARTADIRTAS